MPAKQKTAPSAGPIPSHRVIKAEAAHMVVDFWITKGGVELGYLMRTEWVRPVLPRIGETICLDMILSGEKDFEAKFSGTMYKVTDVCWWGDSVTIDCESE